MNDITIQAVRIAMNFAGAFLVSRGILNEAMAEQASGAVLSLVAVGWWAWANRTSAAK